MSASTTNRDERATNPEFVGIGFCSNDHLAVLPFIPRDSKVKMLSHGIVGGGPAANAAVAAAAFGLKSAFVGTVGDDADGRMILADFARQGVDAGGVKIRAGASSAIAYLWIEEATGARSCAWTREGLDELAADEVDLEMVRRAKILHVDGHNPLAAIAAAHAAKDAGVVVSYDAGTVRDGMEELLSLADLLICSAEFARKASGEDDVERAVRKLHARHRPAVCGATMGADGSVCFDGAAMVRCPAFRVGKVVDTTGCGDLFHAGFAARFLETRDLTECQRFGAATSALKCRGVGGRPPVAPTRKEVVDFLKANGGYA